MKLSLVIIPLAILAGGWFFYKTNAPQVSTPASHTEALSKDAAIETNQSRNPLATTSPSNDRPTGVDTIENLPAKAIADDTNTFLRPNRDDIDLSTIAATSMSDTEFEDLANRIKADPSLLTDILSEFRYNTDPERAKRLAALIGKLKDPQILMTATELAQSGDYQSKINGLELLSRLQPHNSGARDISIELLGSETDPEFLVATMNVLATPATSANPNQQQLLLDNLNLLSNHQEASVRAHSISLLGRWAKDDLSITPLLTAGLSDSSAHVRARAATALIGSNNTSLEMIDGLFAILENPTEKKSTRQTAMLALQKMQLSQPLQARLLAGQTALRTRQVTQ